MTIEWVISYVDIRHAKKIHAKKISSPGIEHAIYLFFQSFGIDRNYIVILSVLRVGNSVIE